MDPRCQFQSHTGSRWRSNHMHGQRAVMSVALYTEACGKQAEVGGSQAVQRCSGLAVHGSRFTAGVPGGENARTRFCYNCNKIVYGRASRENPDGRIRPARVRLREEPRDPSIRGSWLMSWLNVAIQ